ncbi:FdhF/YdeP family oxidoreductase [Leucobacter allii]|uniref:FdhF/YdeP family oxidoreductase n=1 Tax=Leucobacter allii TaxID=2932247 RepID=A0ABY4FPF2_9MICO|nr:FdhF/YdeP family oxidoreductase [Leucobacter allii]UOQ58159.1 FdhF/YdeP family oxidoreductase [Leucobacter allii]UOR02741.1 FdhF/YdeP family oxidoreductase [Leucobacter allii]
MTPQAPREDFSDADIEISEPKDYAAGLGGVFHSMEPAIKTMGLARTAKLMTKINHKDGFDCMSCAWPDPDHRKIAEFCENGGKAVTWEATPLKVERAFWQEHSISSLEDKTEYWLGMQGRLVEPLHKAKGSDRYEPISWDAAYRIVADHLRALDSPDEAAFYTSGRASNEAAFVYQLLARVLGTNNLPDCSNMCHESTGTAMSHTVGIGKSTIAYRDFGESDLIIVMGQNPGTNHPRMLTALQEAKENGARIVAVNPLPEAGLIGYKDPQRVRGYVGKPTQIADQFIKIRSGGDMALLQAISQRVLAAEAAAPGTVLDHDFIERHCDGFEEFAAHMAQVDAREVERATGISEAEIDELAQAYLAADKVIICWAMGVTQQRKGVDTIREIINLLLLRGNIGKPGAGASPIRGHSNVQGDRTMGVWEQMPDSFLDALGAEFSFEPPRHHGVDAVHGIRALDRGEIKVWMGLGGNLLGAISDTNLAESAMRKTRLSVQLSTKLNRSHVITGEEALILPVLGRTEVDLQASGPQYVTVEDSVCAVHASHGQIAPISDQVRSETAIVTGIGHALFGDRHGIDWLAMGRDYDVIRDHISRVVPGCESYNEKTRTRDGFVLPNGPRDSRTFPTDNGKAHLTVNELEHVACPPGRLILQTVRSHDQFNTTIYSLNDRYRGIKKGRYVIFVHPDDLAELGIADGDAVDIFSEWRDEPDRVLRGFRAVAYPTARGCAAAYFPEANVLVPLDSTALESNTPVSKAVIVRLEPARTPAGVGRPAVV